MGTESPCVPNCPKGLCICQKQHGNQNSGCARWPHSPAVSLAFLLPQLTIPKLPVCHAGVTQSISPSPNLGIWSHLQLSCSNIEPLDGELKIPAILAKSGGLRGTTWKRAEGTRGQSRTVLSAPQHWPLSNFWVSWHIMIRKKAPRGTCEGWFCIYCLALCSGLTLQTHHHCRFPQLSPPAPCLDCSKRRFTVAVNHSSPPAELTGLCTNNISFRRVHRFYYFVKY